MAIGLVGKKCGMTRVFTEAGASIPVTVVEISANRITQVKNTDVDGYQAAAQKGHFAKAGVAAGRGVWEFRANDIDLEGREIGGEILADLFEQGQMVDVTGNSKGKGFQGGVKRHNFSMQDATHGNSVSHRALGSTGQNQSPGKVFKGKKMPGQMGNKRVTVQGLEVISVDVEKGLLVIKGAIPGATGGDVIVRPSVKA